MITKEALRIEYPWAATLKVSCPFVDTRPGIDAFGYGSDVLAEVECLLPPHGHWDNIGQIRVEKMLVQDARRDDISLHAVFAVLGFETLFALLFTDDGDIRPDLHVKPGWVDLQIIKETKVPAEYRTESVVVRSIQSLIGFLGGKDLIAVLLSDSQEDGVDLTPRELEILQFKRIAGTNVAYRDPSWIELDSKRSA